MPVVPFVDYSSSRVMHQQAAELYERQYPWGAEDFVTNLDHQNRCRGTDTYVTNLHLAINQMHKSLTSHTHLETDQGVAKPSGPPILPVVWVPPTTIVKETNSTGSATNLQNTVIPYLYLSYIDTRTTGNTNLPAEVFRRGRTVSVNTLPLTPPDRTD